MFVVRGGVEPPTLRFSGAFERYLDIACHGLMCLSAGTTVALGRLTPLGGWQRWLPEWLPNRAAPASPGYENAARRLPLSPVASRSPGSLREGARPPPRAAAPRARRPAARDLVTPASTRARNAQLTRRGGIAVHAPTGLPMPGTVEHRQAVPAYRINGLPGARQPGARHQVKDLLHYG
jgi:hypothetical protein